MRIKRTHVALAASLLLNVVGIPGLIEDARTWENWLAMGVPDWGWVNYLLVALGGVAFCYAFFPILLRCVRHVAGPMSFSGNAAPIAFSVTVQHASGTAYPPEIWTRLWNYVTRRRRLRGVPDLQKCLDELIKYSGYEFPAEITAGEIELSNTLLVHLKRACVILDRQGITHPEVEKHRVVVNYTEWIECLSELLARDDAQ